MAYKNFARSFSSGITVIVVYMCGLSQTQSIRRLLCQFHIVYKAPCCDAVLSSVHGDPKQVDNERIM